MSKRTAKLRCCVGCGTDTRNESGYCSRCLPRSPSFANRRMDTNEYKDRSSLSPQQASHLGIYDQMTDEWIDEAVNSSEVGASKPASDIFELALERA